MMKLKLVQPAAEGVVNADAGVFTQTRYLFLCSSAIAKSGLSVGGLALIKYTPRGRPLQDNDCFGLARVWPCASLSLTDACMSLPLRASLSISFGDQFQVSGWNTGRQSTLDNKVNYCGVATSLVVEIVGASEKDVEDSSLALHRYFENEYISVGDCVETSVCGQRVVVCATEIINNIENKMDDTITNIYKISTRTKQSVKARPSAPKNLLLAPTTNETLPNHPKSQNSTDGNKKYNAIKFKDIGGLDTQLQKVFQLLELPLKQPHVLQRYGLKPLKGILLHGPPGTGKTMIARALGQELDVNIVSIDGSEVLGKYYGESEDRLRTVFAEANEKAPCIVFIDEIDALCPSREDSKSDVEARVVATLLNLMDSIQVKVAADDNNASSADGELKSAQVVVIGATNRINVIDSALRRPGRFDQEIEIGIPGNMERNLILNTILSNIPHCLTSTEIQDVSSQLHGYVGADINTLCTEAGLLCIKRIHRFYSTGSDDSSSVDLEYEFSKLRTDDDSNSLSSLGMEVSYCDIIKAMSLIKPSAMREICVEVPKVYWGDIGGQQKVIQQLKEAALWPLYYPHVFKNMGITPPRGVLLYGPPGCSKTLLAKALATESKLNFVAVKGPELFNKWVGESEKAVRQLFKKARAASPCIVFFDEIDAIAGKRTSDNGSNVAERVLTQLLNELDGVDMMKDVTVLAATNRPDSIDAALLRPGRIDRILYVGPPDMGSRQEIIKIVCRKIPNCLSSGDVEQLALKCKGFSGAEISASCKEAAMCALRENKQAKMVDFGHFVTGFQSITPGISEEMVQYYEHYSRGGGGGNKSSVN